MAAENKILEVVVGTYFEEKEVVAVVAFEAFAVASVALVVEVESVAFGKAFVAAFADNVVVLAKTGVETEKAEAFENIGAVVALGVLEDEIVVVVEMEKRSCYEIEVVVEEVVAVAVAAVVVVEIALDYLERGAVVFAVFRRLEEIEVVEVLLVAVEIAGCVDFVVVVKVVMTSDLSPYTLSFY